MFWKILSFIEVITFLNSLNMIQDFFEFDFELCFSDSFVEEQKKSVH